ncbi:hypothetical protein AAKU55_001213 [Oxalobacteraceae bacterium GrIS 1.11]
MKFAGMHISERTTGRTVYQRVALFVVLMILAMQLLVSHGHDHAITEHVPDCASCHLASHFPTYIPPDNIDIAPAPSRVAYRLAPASYYFFMPNAGYLSPPSHAPPRLS